MPSIITATTTSGLTHSADNSGVLQLASGTGNLVTVPSVTGTAMVSGNMPAFSAYMDTNQTITSGTTVKVTLGTEVFDTANCFSSSRFTPNVAGYYQINGKIRASGTNCTASVSIYKNGSQNIIGTYLSATGATVFSVVSTVLYLNGTTDYVELYGYADATVGSPTLQFIAVGNTCEMNGCLVRGA